MKRFIDWIDEMSGTTQDCGLLRTLERIAFVFLVIMLLSAPHSIAATQTAWLIGMLAWVIRCFMQPRPRICCGALGGALIAFFLWTVLSSIFSYAPDISLDKLRGVVVFLIFFYVINVVKNLRAVHFLAFALIASCMVNVVWTPIQKFIGRGVEVHGITADSPLLQVDVPVQEGDTLLRANKKKLGTPADLIAELEAAETVRLEFYRLDATFTVDLSRQKLLPGSSELERLGFTSWNRSSNFRAAGFYGHYTTYSEVLQLIGSLVLGLFIAGIASGNYGRASILLLVSFAGTAFALLLTVTRASQLALMISSLAIVLAGASRRLVIGAFLAAVPCVLIGLYVLQQNRQVGFFDATDNSTKWRLMVYREGFDLWTQNARHFLLGVGMDSIKRHAGEWHLIDDGRQPMGHLHSTPLQLVVERGFPALILWLIVLGVYVRSLWHGIRSSEITDWRSRGILLGCLGGTIGFFASGLVHYNLGDAEVAMVFYILMGLSAAVVSRQ